MLHRQVNISNISIYNECMDMILILFESLSFMWINFGTTLYVDMFYILNYKKS